MCGRFSLTTEEQRLNEFFRLAGGTEPYVPRYNGAPTQQLAVITAGEPRKLSFYRWGLIPSWSKEMPRTAPVINARAETLNEKPMFRQLLKSRRCLVPADGFYEWKRTSVKQPYRFLMADEQPFAMAGLWDTWRQDDGRVLNSFTIITTTPNKLMEPVHDRMPVILEKENYDHWLSSTDLEFLRSLLVPVSERKMKAYKVGQAVNSVKSESPSLILPMNEDNLFGFE